VIVPEQEAYRHRPKGAFSGQRSDRGTWAAVTRSDILEADPQQRLAGGAEVDLVEVPLE